MVSVLNISYSQSLSEQKNIQDNNERSINKLIKEVVVKSLIVECNKDKLTYQDYAFYKGKAYFLTNAKSDSIEDQIGVAFKYKERITEYIIKNKVIIFQFRGIGEKQYFELEIEKLKLFRKYGGEISEYDCVIVDKNNIKNI